MKLRGVLNPQILHAIAALGHTQLLVIADAGLPIPSGVQVIDVSVSAGVPGFIDVFGAVKQELVVESYIYAAETAANNKPVYENICSRLAETEGSCVSHEQFKKLTGQATAVIRTGECSKYANLILVGGTNF